jgi:hypothetical protein
MGDIRDKSECRVECKGVLGGFRNCKKVQESEISANSATTEVKLAGMQIEIGTGNRAG